MSDQLVTKFQTLVWCNRDAGGATTTRVTRPATGRLRQKLRGPPAERRGSAAFRQQRQRPRPRQGPRQGPRPRQRPRQQQQKQQRYCGSTEQATALISRVIRTRPSSASSRSRGHNYMCATCRPSAPGALLQVTKAKTRRNVPAVWAGAGVIRGREPRGSPQRPRPPPARSRCPMPCQASHWAHEPSPSRCRAAEPHAERHDDAHRRCIGGRGGGGVGQRSFGATRRDGSPRLGVGPQSCCRRPRRCPRLAVLAVVKRPSIAQRQSA